MSARSGAIHPAMPAPGTARARSIKASSLSSRHPLCLGDWPVVVFSGTNESMNTLAGEMTARVIWKFVAEDPRLPAAGDFARASGAMLPRWPHPIDRGVPGVCFVLDDEDHPAAAALVSSGAAHGDAWIALDRIAPAPSEGNALHGIPVSTTGTTLLLGFGHQGQLLARALLAAGVPAAQILVHDDSVAAQTAAEALGLTRVSDALAEAPQVVIATPLMHHERIEALRRAFEARGTFTVDRRVSAAGLDAHTGDSIRLTSGARRALTSAGPAHCLQKHPELPPLPVQWTSVDRISWRGHTMYTLRGPQRRTLDATTAFVDLLAREVDAPEPFALSPDGTHFVDVDHRSEGPLFAARWLCEQLWPEITARTMPARHAADLGATAFERLLRAWLDVRDPVPAMLTPSQRGALGIAAAAAPSLPIVEIGSASGGSGLLLAAATAPAQTPLISIDPDVSTRDLMRFVFEREGFGSRLVTIVQPSEAAVEETRRHCRRGAGILFIDGLHTSEGVRSDFDLYADLLVPGGMLLFHDVCPAIQSVMSVVLGDVARDRRFALLALVDGLAIFQRRT